MPFKKMIMPWGEVGPEEGGRVGTALFRFNISSSFIIYQKSFGIVSKTCSIFRWLKFSYAVFSQDGDSDIKNNL